MKPKFVSTNAVKPASTREERIQDVEFTVYKFTDRERPPESHKNIYFSCFSEFGCETVATGYCIPRFIRKFPEYYHTAIGWHGREFLYRHLVDEYWEIKEEFQHLREYCRAFHHVSKNLKEFEKKVRKEKGILVTSQYMGRLVLGTQCEDCGTIWTPPVKAVVCEFCLSRNLRQPFFRDIDRHRQQSLVFPNKPSEEKMQMVREKYLGINPVAIFARGRKTYGRNLDPDFYVKLIKIVRDAGYDPIWLGEKTSTQPCPVDDVIDFSRMPEARDLETTLAIVSQCSFTTQFWTASTRLAAMTGTPYLLFESPDQLWGKGQEGMRLELLTPGRKKISANDFKDIYEDQDGGLAVFEECLCEMEQGNYSDHMGMVANRQVAYHHREEFQKKLGRK